MFYHHAIELDSRRFTALMNALIEAATDGDFASCLGLFDRVAWERQAESIKTVTVLDADAAHAACGAAEQVAPGLGRRLAASLGQPVRLETLQRLLRAVQRHTDVVALDGPGFLLEDIAIFVAQLVDELGSAPEIPNAPPPREISELPSARAELLSFLVSDIVEVIAPVVGAESIGIGERMVETGIARDFASRYPDAGSFWGVHSSTAGVPREQYEHPVWLGGPAELPEPLLIGAWRAILSEGSGYVTIVRPASAYAPDHDETALGFHQAVEECQRRGSVVASWVEFQP